MPVTAGMKTGSKLKKEVLMSTCLGGVNTRALKSQHVPSKKTPRSKEIYTLSIGF